MTSNNRRRRLPQKSVTNQLYNQANAPIICLAEDLFAYPVQFHQLVSNQPIENSSKELIQQAFSTPEIGESAVQQVNEFFPSNFSCSSFRINRPTKNKKKRKRKMSCVHMILSKISFFAVVRNHHVQL